MKKLDLLPVFAALLIVLLVIPYAALPVQAVTPSSRRSGSFGLHVVTIAEDDEMRQKGIMVLGLDPDDYGATISATYSAGWRGFFTDSQCTLPVTTAVTVGPEVFPDDYDTEPVYWAPGWRTYYYRATGVTGDPCVLRYFLAPWSKGYGVGWDLLSQHKILVTLDGVPTTPDEDLTWCEIVEKEKAKIPPQTEKPLSKRQFPDEDIKTVMIDVTDNFVCKFRWAKPGVGVLDVYFVGVHAPNFIADHMLIVTVGKKVNRTTYWATDIQDICILGWSMDDNELGIRKFEGYYLSEGYYSETYWSWPDPLHEFVGCEEAALWQLTWTTGAWPWGEN